MHIPYRQMNQKPTTLLIKSRLGVCSVSETHILGGWGASQGLRGLRRGGGWFLPLKFLVFHRRASSGLWYPLSFLVNEGVFCVTSFYLKYKQLTSVNEVYCCLSMWMNSLSVDEFCHLQWSDFEPALLIWLSDVFSFFCSSQQQMWRRFPKSKNCGQNFCKKIFWNPFSLQKLNKSSKIYP